MRRDDISKMKIDIEKLITKQNKTKQNISESFWQVKKEIDNRDGGQCKKQR